MGDIHSASEASHGLPKSGKIQSPVLQSVTTAAELKAGAATLTGRTRLLVRPLDGDIWVSHAAGVTDATGWAILSGEIMQFAGDDPVYAIADAGAVSVNVWEIE